MGRYVSGHVDGGLPGRALARAAAACTALGLVVGHCRTEQLVVRALHGAAAVRRINPDYVAQRIEKAEPELKTGLVSWLQLESMPDSGVPRGIMAGLARHAARHIHADDPSSSLDTRLLIKTIGLTMLLMATMAVYGMLAPKSVWDTGKRVLMPWSRIAAPARVQLVELTPGAAEITQGKPLRLMSSSKVCAAVKSYPCVIARSTANFAIK